MLVCLWDEVRNYSKQTMVTPLAWVDGQHHGDGIGRKVDALANG